MFTIAFILSLITLVISVPIFLVFGLGSSIAAVGGLNLPWSVLIQVSFGALTKHVLIAVPLFIFAGMAMLKGGAATRLVKFTTTLVGHWPGGLGVATPNPPGQCPTKVVVNLTNLVAAPPLSIAIPAKINRGTAIKTCLVNAPNDT